MKIFRVIALLVLLMSTGLMAKDVAVKDIKAKVEEKSKATDKKVTNEDLVVYEVDNSAGKFSPKTIAESLKKAGFVIQVNRDMNGPFKKQFQKSSFDTYNLLTAYHKDLAVKLVAKNPLSGIFVPFSASIYQKTGEKTLHVSFLSAKALTKIVGDNGELYKELEKKIRDAITSAMPKAKEEVLGYAPVAVKEKLVSEFSMEVEDDEAEDTKDELSMVLESGLKPIGFIKAGFNSFDMVMSDAKNDDYDFYDAYSLCKLKVIYNVAITHPEAGAFAPCTLVVYHKNKTDKITIAFPNVYNWFSTLALKDQKLKDLLLKAQKDITDLIKSAIE